MSEAGERLPERILIVIDEGSTISMTHLAEIVRLAERNNAKLLVTGDHQQLAAVESGGGMSLLAGYLGHTQLAVPVRFTAEWEQRASLRLREGDKSALKAYDEHGRITGGDQAQVFEDARRAYVAARLAGEQVLLMAYTREDCRELSRIIRDDLIHPDKPIEPLRSAEPRAPEGDEITKPQPEAGPAETPEWATQLAEQRRAFQEKLAERENVMVPDEDPDYSFLGQAWPWQERDPDAILQPPKPELWPCAGIERLAGYEMPDREAGA